MTQFAWPNGCRGAVSLTFDDGMVSQAERAIPILQEHGLRGTFYVNPTEAFLARVEPWIQAAVHAHEIGNHTMTHPCSQNHAFITENGRRGLEQMSLDDMEAEIVATQEHLDTLLPQQGRVSFAYPCYQPFVGKGASRQSYVPVVLQHCIAGRGRGEAPNDPWHCDVGYLWSFPCERMTGNQLVGMVEEAARTGRWTILTFHGIHEGHLAVADRDFEQLCRHLESARDRVWTPTVAEGAAWVCAAQEKAAER